MHRARRHFLLQSAAAAAALAVGLPGWAATRCKLHPGRPIGMQLYSISRAVEKDPDAVFAQLVAFGYREVEAGKYARLAPSAVRHAAQKAGLLLRCARLDAANREDLSAEFDIAHDMGALQVASSVLPPEPQEVTSFLRTTDACKTSDYQRMAERANRIGEAAQRVGLSYAYHNHNFEFRDLGGGICGYDVLLRETEPRYVKFQLDCAWISLAGRDAAVYLKRHAGRFSSLHIKNIDAVTRSTLHDGAALLHITELGQGAIDYRPILAQALQQNIPYLTIEHDPREGVQIGMDMVKREFDFLQGLLAAA
ncbi:sugar phosphate isomerase/epimerase family protein [Comamonas sp. GB3 AK4-5]|uniref:sugar phosphate isomerase/epimerase family protein n=1 Tax=Comamonas sp. GB3 AK4-5 TaxID=3231487 RepID=UPI00351EE140